jgi:hypothetical protein
MAVSFSIRICVSSTWPPKMGARKEVCMEYTCFSFLFLSKVEATRSLAFEEKIISNYQKKVKNKKA